MGKGGEDLTAAWTTTNGSGIKSHVLTCSFGFVLAALVVAANVHDTGGAGILLERAAEDGWDFDRIKVDGIYAGPRMETATHRHGMDVQVSSKPPQSSGFMPLPIRWCVEATLDTQTNRYRRLARNLEQDEASAEDVFHIAAFSRVLRNRAEKSPPFPLPNQIGSESPQSAPTAICRDCELRLP